jgi:O-antigen ligase
VGFDQGQLFLERAYIQLEIAQDFVSHAHNDYIQMLAETGIVGFSAYMLLLGWTLTQTFKLRKSHFNWAVSLFCAQIYVLLGSLTQANFSDSEVNHFLVFSWAIVSVLSNRRSEK